MLERAFCDMLKSSETTVLTKFDVILTVHRR